MTPDDESWRQHEVPTFTQTEDTWFAGLTPRQLAGLVIALSVGYAIFQFAPLWFLPTLHRLALGVVVALLIAGFVTLRPGGKSMFGLVREYVGLFIGMRYMVAADRYEMSASSPRQPKTRRRRFRLPFIGGKGASGVLLIMGGGMLLTACGSDVASAQIADDYRGRRVYLQSIVTNLRINNSADGNSVTIRLKAAAPLASVEPRVHESLQSVTELEAHKTRLQRAVSVQGFRHTAKTALSTGDQFAFEDIYIGDTVEFSTPNEPIRPYCDVSTALRRGLFMRVGRSKEISGRVHSDDCRLLAAGALKPSDDAVAVRQQESLGKPVVAVEWEDRKRNRGSLNIAHGMLPYPRPVLASIEPTDYIDQLVDSTEEARLLNRFSICAPHEVKVLSLGIQQERPSGLSAEDDYFDGQRGQRLAGEVQVCKFEARENVEVLMPEMAVFAQGDPNLELKVRPVVSTSNPQNDIETTARLRVFHSGVGEDDNNVDLGFVNFQTPERTTTSPSVKFNVPISDALYEDKTYSTDFDSARITLQVLMEHKITVKRPPEQRIDHYPVKHVTHISSCGCTKSGGTCSPDGGTCRCGCSSYANRTTFEYYPDHYRVAANDRLYTQDNPSAERTYTFNQVFTFEDFLITFDRPYEELVYVEPTPRPGELDKPDYVELGGSMGRRYGERFFCTRGVAMDSKGESTGWIWVEPGTNSQGEAYGGCRRNFGCKLDIPEVEEPFGPGGMPTEEDYECVNR